MAVRAFIPYGDPRLHRATTPVAEITETVRMIWDDMIETMDAMPGVGLAAPQIGIMMALAVVDASSGRGEAVCMANPQVLHASVKLREYEEASPNLPGVSAPVTRPRAVTVQFLNETGQIEERDFVGLWATSVQHQIDHLAGRVYVDHLTPLRRKMLIARSAKLSRR